MESAKLLPIQNVPKKKKVHLTPEELQALVDDAVCLAIEDQKSKEQAKEQSKKEQGVMITLERAWKDPVAFLLGALIGGCIPTYTFDLVHNQIPVEKNIYKICLLAGIVLAGLLWSSKSVFIWGKEAFCDKYKAFGFTVLLEGTMMASNNPWVFFSALGILMSINALVVGANFSRIKL